MGVYSHMKMVKCLKGHKYNADKFNSCPQCAALRGMAQPKDFSEEPQSDVDTEEPDMDRQQKYEIVGRRKVVGCLVCVKGAMQGEGFFLVEGQNDIGRGANLEVVLSKELTVSRKAQACILYDKKENRFYLTAEEGRKEVLCNGKVVTKKIPLVNESEIQIGQCVLRFVAFCNGNFMWKN